jgi:putative redox protein
MRSKKITFKNSQGQLLSGILDFPVIGEAGLFAIFAHCFTCSKNLKTIDTISRALTDQNIAVLRFDFTGLGQSQGAFSDTNFSTNITDLENAYSFLEDNYEAPQLIIGHSLGGAAVLHVSKHLKAIQAVATIGAPAEPEHVRHLFDAGTSELKTKGEAEVNIGGRPFKVKKQFLDDLENAGGTAAISKLEKALLVLHSP